MDAVSQKNIFLSMTGIDQTEENTDDILELQNLVFPFAQNVVPYIVLKNNVTQIIDGNKTFLFPISTNGFKPLKYNLLGKDFYEPIIFNPDGKYQMTFDVYKGLEVRAPINLMDNALYIKNISGLQDALNSRIFIPDQSITTEKIALGTILGNTLNPAISFSTTGDIASIGARFAVCNSMICQAGSYRFQNTTPLLNVIIPFIPAVTNVNPNTNVINFFLPNGSNMYRYRHPVDYQIHSMSILSSYVQAVDYISTINIYTYDKDGRSSESVEYPTGYKLLFRKTFTTIMGSRCDVITFDPPIFVTKDRSIGGDHSYNIVTTNKNSYIIHGFQS
jgi:hypothetical protein